MFAILGGNESAYPSYDDLGSMSGRDIVCSVAIAAQGAYVVPGGLLVGLFATGLFVAACL